MKVTEEMLFTLAHVPNFTQKHRYEFMRYVKQSQSENLEDAIEGWNQDQKSFRLKPAFFERFDADQKKQELEEWGIQFIPLTSPKYPEYLRNIFNPPFGLFVKGNPGLMNQVCLAVVGSRQASTYGKKVVEQLLPEIIEQKIVIVSGLARGVDTHAHNTTLNHGGSTIAVIGNGIDYFYPHENYSLQTEIGANHCLISEYPLGSSPQKSHFPDRNRIIAGLSRGTLVVEAKYRSGSLITTDLALNFGREVFAVPGSIFSELSAGTNDIIKNGAKAVLSAQDILEDLLVF